MQSSVTCNSLCGERVNMMEERPLMASGRKTTNRIHDNNICVCTVYIYYVYTNTHKYNIYFENIYIYLHLYIYINILYYI